ncbi:hypothetical protein [Bradyrhizobium sp. USDA 10063]
MPDDGSGIFFADGLDRLLVICPSGCLSHLASTHEARFAGNLAAGRSGLVVPGVARKRHLLMLRMVPQLDGQRSLSGRYGALS